MLQVREYGLGGESGLKNQNFYDESYRVGMRNAYLAARDPMTSPNPKGIDSLEAWIDAKEWPVEVMRDGSHL